MQKQIYLAGGWFTPKQASLVERAHAALKQNPTIGYIHSPQEHQYKGGLLCQESGHKSTNKFDFQFKLLNLIFGGRSFSPVQILKTL